MLSAEEDARVEVEKDANKVFKGLHNATEITDLDNYVNQYIN
jgi:hypothetical protein